MNDAGQTLTDPVHVGLMCRVPLCRIHHPAVTDEAPAGLPQIHVRNCESQKGKRTIWLFNSTAHCQPTNLRTKEEHPPQPWWTRHPPEQGPSTSTRPTKCSRPMTKAGGRGPVERSRPRPTRLLRQTPKPRRDDHVALQDVQCVGCTARVQQVQGRDGPQEKITKKRRAKRYRVSAADAERPRRVAERARTCATTNQPPPCAASAEAKKRAQRQPPWKLCPARLLVHPLLLQNKLALLVLLRFLVGLQLQTRVKATATERREWPRTARDSSSVKRNTHAKSMQHKPDKG